MSFYKRLACLAKFNGTVYLGYPSEKLQKTKKTCTTDHSRTDSKENSYLLPLKSQVIMIKFCHICGSLVFFDCLIAKFTLKSIILIF